MALTRTLVVLVFLLGLAAAPAAWAAERGTAAEAQAMVARAIAAYDAKGKAVFAEMTAPNTAFVDRDLYIFVVGPDHRNVAHAADAARVGVDLWTQTDVDGKAYGKAFFAEATEQGAWVDYKWKDPLTGEIEPKSTWVVLHDGYIFGCGIYKP